MNQDAESVMKTGKLPIGLQIFPVFGMLTARFRAKNQATPRGATTEV